MPSELMANITYTELIEIAIAIEDVKAALYSCTTALAQIVESGDEMENPQEALIGAISIIYDQRAKLDSVSTGISKVEPTGGL